MTEQYFWVGSQPEKDDLKALRSEGLSRVAGTKRLFERRTMKEKTMRLDLGIMAGPESKAFLADLTKQIDRLERLTKGKGLAATTDEEEELETASDDAEETETVVEDDEDFAPKKSAKTKKASSFDDDETETEETEEEEAPVAKKTKARKFTMDDVNDACKLRAQKGGKKGVAEVRAILQKKFKTQSIADLKPEQYSAAIAAMTA